METIGLLLFGLLVGNTYNDEPHWSFRDGCKVQNSQAANGSYVGDSYDHCKSLPRVYSGKEWKPVPSRSKTA